MAPTGPKEWDLVELALADALDHGPVNEPTLENDLHPILARDRWSCHDEEFAILLPSLRLASRLLEAGMPWIARFMEAAILYYGLPEEEQKKKRINLKYPLWGGDLEDAKKELLEIAKITTFELNDSMLADHGWMGITRPHATPRPWGVLEPWTIEAEDNKSFARGETRRRQVVGVMSEYVNVMRESDPTSERYLRAAFSAANTINHEIGHVVYHMDFRSLDLEDCSEIWVGDEHWCELGHSFMSFIFSGYLPQFCQVGDRTGKEVFDFKHPLCWEEHSRGFRKRRPIYKTQYSISTSYIERLFSENFWSDLPPSQNVEFSAKARGKLMPETSPQSFPPPATAEERQYKYLHGNLAWVKSYGDRGKSPGEPFKVLCRAEIDYARKKDRANIEQWNKALGLGDSDEEDVLSSESFDVTKRIDDGWLRALIQKSRHDFTRIEVLYERNLGDKGTKLINGTKKRAREDDNGDAIQRPPKKPKSALSRDAKVETFLKAISLDSMEQKYTHLRAYEFCIAKKIALEPGYFKKTPYWQETNLNRHIVDDRFVMEAIRRLLIMEYVDKLDANDDIEVHAIVKLQQELLFSVKFWGEATIVDHCREHDLDYKGYRDKDVVEVMKWITSNIMMTRRDYEQNIESKGISPAGHDFYWSTVDDLPASQDDPKNWTAEDYQAYLRTKKLPEWGRIYCWRERVIRHREELRTGNSISRDVPSIQNRIDTSGNEIYIFKAYADSTPVAALRSALFIAGRFRPGDELTLYRRDERDKTLIDGKLLSQYLTVGDPGNLLVTLKVTPAAEVDQSRATDPVKYDARTHNPTVAAIPQDPPVTTVKSMMRNLALQAEKLNQTTKPSGGRDVLHPITLNLKSKSGEEMLNELEDYEQLRDEDQDLRKRMEDEIAVDNARDNIHATRDAARDAEANWRNRDGELRFDEEAFLADDDLVAPANGTSIMADIYKNLV